MSECKWTPGPWVALPLGTRLIGMANQPLFDDGRWVILPEHHTERLPLAEVDMGDDHHVPTRKRAEYDARLIAAAPKLYEALEPFANYACDEPCGCHNCTARAVMAEARGES